MDSKLPARRCSKNERGLAYVKKLDYVVAERVVVSKHLGLGADLGPRAGVVAQLGVRLVADKSDLDSATG